MSAPVLLGNQNRNQATLVLHQWKLGLLIACCTLAILIWEFLLDSSRLLESDLLVANSMGWFLALYFLLDRQKIILDTDRMLLRKETFFSKWSINYSEISHIDVSASEYNHKLWVVNIKVLSGQSKELLEHNQKEVITLLAEAVAEEANVHLQLADNSDEPIVSIKHPPHLIIATVLVALVVMNDVFGWL